MWNVTLASYLKRLANKHKVKGCGTEMRSVARFHTFCCVAVILHICLAPDARGAESAPHGLDYNVLLISVDTVRADHLGCYGYERMTSPNIDKLAHEGVLFENLTAASPWTIPSHMSMFTSLYPSVHGVEDTQRCLGDRVPTLARVLANHGYVTAGFASGPSLNHRFGFDRGFGFYDDFTVTLMHEANLFDDLSADSSGINDLPTNHVITNLASTWLRGQGHKRFFLFVHYWDCHSDYVPPAPYDSRFDPDYEGDENGRDVYQRKGALEKGMAPEDLAHLVALYDGEIAHTDDHVGKLLSVLEEKGFSDKTLVILVSDHGEGFLEHGRLHHGNTLYEEMVHVPFIMRLPGLLPAGLRIKGNVGHVDVMPTILSLLSIELPSHIQGMDLSGACLSESEIPDRMVFSEVTLSENMRAVRWGSFKLIQQAKKATRPLLLIRDGKEMDARTAGLNAADCTAIEKQLALGLTEDLVIQGQDDHTAQPAELEDKTMRLLQSLGYM